MKFHDQFTNLFALGLEKAESLVEVLGYPHHISVDQYAARVCYHYYNVFDEPNSASYSYRLEIEVHPTLRSSAYLHGSKNVIMKDYCHPILRSVQDVIDSYLTLIALAEKNDQEGTTKKLAEYAAHWTSPN